VADEAVLNIIHKKETNPKKSPLQYYSKSFLLTPTSISSNRTEIRRVSSSSGTVCVDGATAAQGGGGLPLLEGGQPAQLEALALPGADERATASSGGLRQVRENNIQVPIVIEERKISC
jgi:hypothetical protein